MNIKALWKDPDYYTATYEFVTIIDILSDYAAAVVDKDGHVTRVNLRDLQVVDKDYLPK